MRAGYGQYSPRSLRAEQEKLLRGADCGRVFFDSKDEREQKQLNECMDWLAGFTGKRLGVSGRPTLVVCSLDRLASSIDRLTDVMTELSNRGIAIELLRENVGGTSADALVGVLRLIRDFRRENIADKGQRGVLVAEKRNRQTGRPAKMTEAKLQQALLELREGKPVTEVARRAGVSVPTLYRYKAAHERSERDS